MNRQEKNQYSVKERWYGRNTKLDRSLKSGKKNREYNIELLIGTSFAKGKYAVHESWGVIGKPSKVSIVIFRSKKKANEYFQKEVIATISREYKKINTRWIKY